MTTIVPIPIYMMFLRCIERQELLFVDGHAQHQANTGAYDTGDGDRAPWVLMDQFIGRMGNRLDRVKRDFFQFLCFRYARRQQLQTFLLEFFGALASAGAGFAQHALGFMDE